MVKIGYPSHHGGLIADILHDGADFRFLFSQIQLATPDSETMSVALGRDQAAEFVAHLEGSTAGKLSISITVHQPVDLLFFHGPHFQDRYGIAETAFSALDHSRVRVHAAGCTGTSVYLVADSGQGKLIREMLSDAFTVPKEHTRK